MITRFNDNPANYNALNRKRSDEATEAAGRTRMSTFALFAAYAITVTSVLNRFGLGNLCYAAMLCVGLYLFLNMGALLAVIKRAPCALFAGFIVWVVICACVNSYRVSGVDIVKSAVIALVPIIEVGLLVAVYAERGNLHRVIDLFFWWQLILVSLNDLLLLFAPDLFGMESAFLAQYLIGNKFAVVYEHFLLITFFLLRRDGASDETNNSILPLLLLVALTLVVSVLVDCMTGVIGAVLLYCFNRLVGRFPHVMTKPCILVGVLLLACSFMFVYDEVLNNGAIKFILEDVLNTTTDITGRSQIYEQLPLILGDHLVYGYGYGTCHILGPLLGNFVDTQNGLAEWVWRAGIPAVVVLCMFLWSCANHGRKAITDNGSRAIKVVAPLLSYLLTLSVLASVEITVSSAYFIAAFLLASSDCCADCR